MKRCCLALLDHLAAEGVTDLNRLRVKLIHGFLLQQGSRYSRVTMVDVASIVRGFLSFIFRRGITQDDLSAAVVSPRLFRHEQCPRFLTPTEIEAVFVVIDCQTVQGRRDYAMLSVLATYGLRGIEVLRLALTALHAQD